MDKSTNETESMQSYQSVEADRKQRSERFYRLLLNENMRLRKTLDAERQGQRQTERGYVPRYPSGVGPNSIREMMVQPSHQIQSGTYMGSQLYSGFRGYGQQQPSNATELDFSMMDGFDFDLQLP